RNVTGVQTCALPIYSTFWRKCPAWNRTIDIVGTLKMNVGFIGLGRMGSGMARRILGAGNDLAVYDVVREATAPFAAAGARVASRSEERRVGKERRGW